MTSLDTLHLGLRVTHIVAGFLGLALFWVPVFAAKGGRLHVRAGWAFVCCAGCVGVSGLISCSWGLLHLPSLLGTGLQRIPEHELPHVMEQARFLFAILGYLSLAVLSGLWFGLEVVRTRNRHETLRSPLLLGLHGATGLWALGLFAFGAWTLIASHRGSHLLSPEASSRYWIPVILGLVGLLGAKGDLDYALRPRPSRMAWWYKHMENMLGVGIAFHTAFLVLGVNRLFRLPLSGAWQLLPWVLPTAIGVPAIHFWVRWYQRRFGELPIAKQTASKEETAGVKTTP